MGIALDLRYGLRFLRATPSFTIPALVSLALGIALNTTMFSIVSATLLRPVVDADPDLVRVGRSLRAMAASVPSHTTSSRTSARMQLHSRTLRAPRWKPSPSPSGTLPKWRRWNSWPEVISECLTCHFFREAPFAIPDNPRGGPGVAVVSERFWRRHLAADAGALGRTLLVNNVPLTVVGVVSQEFRGVAFPGVVIDVWLPIGLTHEVLHRNDQFPPSMGVLARLKDGVTMTAARAELDVLAVRMSDESPARDRDRGFVVGDSSGVHPRIARVLRVIFSLLMATVGIVLLIACANVAGGLLARAAARQRELGIRLALGATRRRVVGQLLVESLLLAVLGAAAGVALSVWPIQLLNAVASRFDGPAGVPMFLGLALDTRVLLFTAVVASLTAIVFGLVPALQATRVNLVDALRGTRKPSGGRGRLRAALLISPTDVFTFASVSALLLLVTLAAGWMTVRQGLRVDPVALLRE